MTFVLEEQLRNSTIARSPITALSLIIIAMDNYKSTAVCNKLSSILFSYVD